MRAGSAIYQHIQPPLTIFGMPPVYFLGAIVAVFTTGTVVSPIVGDGLSIIVMLLVAVCAFSYVLNLRRQDPHCETVLLLPIAFFKGKRERHLICGFPLSQPKTKRKVR